MELGDNDTIMAMATDVFGAQGATNLSTLFSHWEHANQMVNELRANGMLLTDEEIEAVDAYGQAVSDLHTTQGDLWRKLGSKLTIRIGTSIPEAVMKLINDLGIIFSDASDQEKREATMRL